MKRLILCGALLWAPLLSANETRDPTRPPKASHAPLRQRDAAPVLSAIFVSGGMRAAIFNGQFVRSGGSVGGYLIETVLDDGVRYRHAGLVQELHLPAGLPNIKKPAADLARTSSGVEP